MKKHSLIPLVALGGALLAYNYMKTDDDLEHAPVLEPVPFQPTPVDSERLESRTRVLETLPMAPIVEPPEVVDDSILTPEGVNLLDGACHLGEGQTYEYMSTVLQDEDPKKYQTAISAQLLACANQDMADTTDQEIVVESIEEIHSLLFDGISALPGYKITSSEDVFTFIRFTPPFEERDDLGSDDQNAFADALGLSEKNISISRPSKDEDGYLTYSAEYEGVTFKADSPDQLVADVLASIARQ